MRRHVHAGIDIDGSRIAGVLLDDAKRELVFREGAVRKSWGPKELRLMLKSFTMELLKRSGRDRGNLDSIGYAIPGIVTPDGRVLKSVNLPMLERANLRTIFPGCRSSVWNGAIAACHVEANLGMLKNVREAVHLVLGTDVGCSRLIRRMRGRILKTETIEITGIEIGHITANIESALLGTADEPHEWEDYCSMKFFALRTKRSLDDLYARRRAGDNEEATRLFIQYGANVGTLLAAIHTLYEPDVITLDGVMLKYFDAYKTSMMRVYKERIFLPGSPPTIKRSELGAKGGSLGAALCAAYRS